MISEPKKSGPPLFWAKTVVDSFGRMHPGISVLNHCLNVGCVGEVLHRQLPPAVQALLPPGSITLTALHDVGKITLGFQSKCPEWLLTAGLDERTRRESLLSVTDHALVSQWFLHPILKRSKAELWSVAVGAHHGKPKGRTPKPKDNWEAQGESATQWRHDVLEQLVATFGPLPVIPPDPRFAPHYSDLWLLAGLITVADWIGSNERFFSPASGQPVAETRSLAANALQEIGWPGGRLLPNAFKATFGFTPNAVQESLLSVTQHPGLVIVEAPMGCGKTEAALAAAQQLIAAGHHHGIYFALPTQVTSNRIHRRVARFLESSLADAAQLRLAHGNSWLETDCDLCLRPTFTGGADEHENPRATVEDARSWFASSKQALLAPYGVGTIDQALQAVVAVKHFFVRRFALAGKVVILDEIHSYDVYTGTLVTALVRELLRVGCTVIVLSATLTAARRRELLDAAECPEATSPADYPLITAGRAGSAAMHVTPAPAEGREIKLRSASIPEEDAVAELVARAESGQHVLWIRNTVVEAQESFRHVRSELCAGEIEVGLLHSRFPLHRRQQLEDIWLERLGRNRSPDGPGSILVATQVVEQSVDIDLDFIISDLAPTDMLLQRMGRLWRHARAHRAAPHPEFWIRQPALRDNADMRSLKKALGRSGRVYAPWVLLRSAAIFADRTRLVLPNDIRSLLEATYAAPDESEPKTWHDLHQLLEQEKQALVENAEAAMRVLGVPTLVVDEHSDQALTRRKGAPTVAVILLCQIELLPGHRIRLTALDHTSIVVSDYDWQLEAARFLHRWLVRMPKWQVPGDAPRPAWLGLHVPGDSTCACVRQEDGRLLFEDVVAPAGYHPDQGVYAEKKPTSSPQSYNPRLDEDDEFDY